MSAIGASARPVDLAHLACYTGGDAALNAEVLQLFADQSARLMRELNDALDAKDGKSWREITHALKGAARGIGAFGLADAAAHAEDSEPPKSGAKRALQTLSVNARSVEIFIEAYLGR